LEQPYAVKIGIRARTFDHISIQSKVHDVRFLE
jgi:hypothetical protein